MGPKLVYLKYYVKNIVILTTYLVEIQLIKSSVKNNIDIKKKSLTSMLHNSSI